MNVPKSFLIVWFSMAFPLHGLALQAQGIPISVVNASFEDPVLADGAISDAAPGWAVTAGGGDGIFNPTAVHYPPAGMAPDGENVAFNNGTDISQILTEVLEANTCYELRVLVGRRADLPFPGYRIELWAGGVVLASESSPSPATPGSFVTAVARYTTDTAPAELGQPLEIHLISNGIQVNFDHVVLTKIQYVPKVQIIWPSGQTGVRFAEVNPSSGLTAADFSAAAAGDFAVPVAPYVSWIPTLPSAPQAKWIATEAQSGGGGVAASALYDITFFNPCTTTKTATLDFFYGVDDALGGPANTEGLYLNGLSGAIPGTQGSPPPSRFQQESFLGPLDVTALIQPGENHLSVYQRDTASIVSGIIFQAEIELACESTMTGQPFTAQFAQVAAGAGSTSSFAVHNPHPNPLSVSLEFFDSAGNLVGNQTTSIAPQGTEALALNPAGLLRAGWARITALAPFTSTEFIDLVVAGGLVPQIGVLPCEPTRKATFYAADQAGRRTGVAVANPNVFVTANIRISQTDPGGTTSGPFPLPPLPDGNHTAFFLADLNVFPTVEGTVTVESDAPVCIVSLFQDAQGALTTVSVSASRP